VDLSSSSDEGDLIDDVS
jgi:hypothetical protein